MDLTNVDLLSLQTDHMKKDPTTIAMCAALNTQFKCLGNDLQSLLIYSRIDYLSDEILDELAFQMHVDWYDSTASIDIKRDLIKNSLKLHRIKGTPQAVENAVKIIFDNVNIEEWFKYNGDPYYFRVNIDIENEAITEEKTKKVSSLINAYKNSRSWLEFLNFNSSIEGKFYSGIAISELKVETINNSFDFTEKINCSEYFSGSVSSLVVQTITMEQPKNVIWGALKATKPTWNDVKNRTWSDIKTYN